MAQGTITTTAAPGVAGRRVPIRYQLAAAAVIVLAVIGYFTYQAASGASNPRSTADAYLAALQRGDAQGAWGYMARPSVPEGVDAAALDEASLAAALRTSRPAFPGLTYVSTGSLGPLNGVDYTYRGANGVQRLEVVVANDSSRRRLLVMQGWAVHVSPIVVSTSVPGLAGGLTVDGRPVKVTPDKSIRIALLPLQHNLTLESAGPTAPADVQVNGLSGASEQTVKFKLALTPAGTDKVRTAVADAFAACSSAPRGCPGTPIYGSVVGYEVTIPPTVTAITNENGDWIATGLYQAVLTLAGSGGSGNRHSVSAGTYTALVDITPSAATVKSIGGPASTPASFSRPASIDDAAARQLVSTAFATCARSTSLYTPDCPQSDPRAVGTVTEIVWHLKGDPLTGSKVAFDTSTGVVQVTGSYSMSVDFKLEGSHFTNDMGNQSYTAELVQTANGLRLVNIQ